MNMATSTVTIRLRSVAWFSAGIAAALALTGVFVGIRAAAAPDPAETTFVPVTPCRLADTRPDAGINVGPRSTPLVADETYAAQVTGVNGNCTIPAIATGISLNVTAVAPSAASFMTIFPSDAARPVVSNLNYQAGSPPTPNKVDVKLSADGKVSFYNLAGNVHVIADVVGYYTNQGIQDLVATKAGKPIVTVLAYNSTNTAATPADTFALIRTVGNFTKAAAATTLRLDWSAHHTGTNGAYCHYQLRIDGRANDGDNALNYQGDQEGNAVAYGDYAPISTFAEFSGVPAGAHAVQIYVRGSGSACTLNNGNFNQQVVVEEFEAAAASAFSLGVAAGEASGSTEGGM